MEASKSQSEEDGAVDSGLMQVDSTRFGLFDVDPGRLLRFTEWLLGFSDSSTYAVIEVEDSPYVWLQSADEPQVAFLATNPFAFFPDYELDLGFQQQSDLGVESSEQVEVLVLLTVNRVGDDPVSITANLLGPIVINVETRSARQLVLDSSGHSTREPLVAA